ncbi:hypothetical protein OAJ82_00390 [Alphaproteobacteria bacterium]|nr:hypothetical protein [Alphaproteobacteria bacterium]
MSDLNYFNKNGFIIKKKLFSKEEIDKLNSFADTSFGKECNIKKPEHDDLSIIDVYPRFEGYKIH